MALPIQTSTRIQVSLPLACDPLMVAANPVGEDGLNPLIRYLSTSDVTGLVVPEGATEIVVRALSRTELAEAEAAAGRYREDYARIYVRALTAAGDLAAAGEDRPTAAALDALTDAEYEAYQAHSRWMERRTIERVRRGLLSISDFPALRPGAKGFPVEEMMAIPIPAATGLDWPDVLDEIGNHIVQVSTLGKVEPRSFDSSSGASCPASSSSTSASGVETPPVMDGSTQARGPSCEGASL